MIRTLLAAIAAVSLSGCVGFGPEPSERETLKIASWNLEHLAAADGQGCRPRTRADYALLRRHAEALGAPWSDYHRPSPLAAGPKIGLDDLWENTILWPPS